jgi:hypothetical protein
VRLADAITRVVPDFFSSSENLATWPEKVPTGRYVPTGGTPEYKFSPAPPKRNLPVNAGQVAIYLTKKIGRAQLVLSKDGIRSQRGIIFFDTIYHYSGSGHISLWDGQRVMDHDFFDRSPRVYFWRLPQ